MFYLEFIGTSADAQTQATNMQSVGGGPDDQMKSVAGLAAANAVVINSLQAIPGYTGNVHLSIRGGWKAGASTITIKLQNVALTNTGNIRSGDPTYRMASA